MKEITHGQYDTLDKEVYEKTRDLTKVVDYIMEQTILGTT